ncbi:STAS domain-containing protein [Sutterella sp. AM11-39]|jgi:ABC-type transporter Mla MlaB component|uniref:STAS domain-containing protein n=1 Tax=Sutterella sp. AM11-39 TaxID=2292075 RepID=UPI000E5301E6|nr:STAS domain-containing protein [Sutterella sp. AM11-39]RHJ35715.1 STAS domain-containing protein [Sutterella sp. AM11-39]HJA17573.1 STAS domain-containing protein [Candidatus Duodenibacillus intestinigallinarum]
MRLSEEKITRGNAVAVKAAVLASAQAGDTVLDFSNVKSVDSTSVSILMSWVRTLQSLQRTPEIRCVPEKMLSLMRLYGVNDLLAPYFK